MLEDGKIGTNGNYQPTRRNVAPIYMTFLLLLIDS